MSDTITTIQTDSTSILNLTNALLPLIEAIDPSIEKNKDAINLAMTAMQALLPLLNLIPTGGTITATQQASLQARVYAILAGKPLGPEWVTQT